MYEVSVDGDFSAAHNLRGYEGQCEKLHGHNWKVRVSVRGEELDETGLLIDFRILKRGLQDELSRFDHCNLNELPEFQEVNPTTENIARILWESLSEKVGTGNLKVSRVTVWEGTGSRGSYEPSPGE